MNRSEFMQRLGVLLSSLPVDERTDAMKYYTDYLDEAGPENESSVLEEIGTPEEVAKNILSELDAKATNESTGFQPAIRRAQQNSAGSSQTGTTSQNYSNQMDAGKVVGIILLCIFLLPVVLPLIFGILAALIGLTIGFAVAAIALAISGIAVFIIGIANLFATPFAGLVLIGVGLLLVAIAILFMVLTVLICGKLLPAICSGIASLWRSVFNKKESVA